ncbi:metal ABC transporter substrate-binding protein [Iamia sp.]|uniref:metal ABC transporter substrate-binding protein n=1 Tax=Iamia sp. TaxID=2722710 RepID=UPI002C6E220D|nr:metal ABC transporter substrate-binding protein [Iamia sp.]HXH58831.1 metal ABC transporter substrate-binding protein [Iamia sp.]
MRLARPLTALPAAGLLLAALSGCGDEDDGESSSAGGDRPTVVVTTNILGDVVGDLVGDEADVTVLMPAGADPHDFQLSARQAAELREADVLITNGAGFEEGMADSLEAAESDGVTTYHAIDGVETIAYGEDAHAGEEAGEHAEEEGEPAEEEGEHADEGADPHFFTDPDRVADAAEGIAEFLAEEIPALDTDGFRTSAEAEVEALRELAAEVEETLGAIAPDDRTMVTNHEVFGYFADRYDFEVVGVVIPGGGTGAEPNAQDLEELAGTIEAEGVPAIFADVSSPETLSEALAREVGDVEVVAVYSESLGEEGSGADTYAGMARTNAGRIVDALS